MTSLAAVVMAHRDAPQVRRLIGALEDVPVVVHCDSKTADDVAGAMIAGWDGRVRAVPRTSATLGSWSLVRVEIDLLRAALQHSSADHIAVLSGSDYPLLSTDGLIQALKPWAGRSYLMNAPIPFEPWSVPRHPDGGRWRTAHRFLHRGDDLVTVRGVPVRTTWQRPLPAGQELRATSQWKILSRHDAELVVRVVDSRPDLVRFWRSTLVPEESVVASVLSSPMLTGEPAVPVSHRHPWFIKWPARGSHHPAWLTEGDFDRVADAARAPGGTPDDEDRTDVPLQKLFARKVSTERSSVLLDRVDAELRR
ncbi:beta-1,6-N-acetylglucosaminyltransferase [Nakamurella leprariae]|uniref:beta-1,6-N-acetylglucosaminyltransferase n=1 Tax=Nakamurella leprariae TaxID=2803911 RepID=UPI0038B28BB5